MNKDTIAVVIADGIVDAEEVLAIRNEVYADGIVDKEEVEELFEINDAVSGKDNDPSWAQLMVDAVRSYALEDEVSPGVVDQEEGDFLADMIEGDGKVDEVEVAILTMLKKEAEAIESDRLNALML